MARELVDADCPHGFDAVVVRDINPDKEMVMKCTTVEIKNRGPLCATIEVKASLHGHPVICQTIRLYAGIRQIYMETRILKDATPLLSTHIAFPFKAANPEFRYEGALAVMNPIRDYLPGSHSDTIAVQNWVKVMDTGECPVNKSATGNQADISHVEYEEGTEKLFNILWSSLDAPIASFGRLWPGYTSPAHRCFFDPETAHNPLRVEDMDRGWIYSTVFTNNYGTNFSVSQAGDVLFRYVVTSYEGKLSDAQAAEFGWQAVTPFEQIFTKHKRQRTLPVKSGFIEINNDNIILLTCKKAEDGRGYILRLWNLDKFRQKVTVKFNYMHVRSVIIVGITEEDTSTEIRSDGNSFELEVEGNSVAALRVVSG